MFKKVTLDNGVRIVSEKIPHVRSVSVGIWVGTGSRSETIHNNGISHFIEHMLFKGTTNRTAKEIAESIDNIGGQLNAFTGKECTCYYAKTLDTHIDVVFDVLADMFFNSKLDEKDIDIEKRVIFEEIGMYEDSPEELVHDIFSERVWGDDSLGYPILGRQQSLTKIDGNQMRKYMENNYIPSNTVISVAGNFSDSQLEDLIEKYFSNWNKQEEHSIQTPKSKFSKNFIVKEKDIEQAHICMGFEGIGQGEDNLYSLIAVNNILGGGMSSRLFQKIREEHGYVYSIYAYPVAYRGNGLYTIYAGMNPEHLAKVIKLIEKEIKLIQEKGISKDELEKSKEQLKGNYILGLESTSSRMNSIGRSELMLNYIYSPEEILQKIDRISQDTVSEAINQVFDLNKVSFAGVGNIKNISEIQSLFK